MMVNPCADSRLMLAWQIDHSRVAGYFLRRIGETKISLARSGSQSSKMAGKEIVPWQ